MPAPEDLKLCSHFVFAASITILDKSIRRKIPLAAISEFCFPCLSNDLRCYAVAIVVEAKATALLAAHTLAKIQWKTVAYLQIMDQISIACEATYADHKNICQYKYLIYGLSISIWKMSLRLNIGKRRQSHLLSEYFSFPTQCLGFLSIDNSIELEKFVKLHKKILSW